MGIVVKDFGIILVGLYSYKKINNMQLKKSITFISVIYALLVSVLLYLLDDELMYISMPLVFVFIYLFVIFGLGEKNRNCFLKCIISFALSYITFCVSGALLSFVLLLFPIDFSVKNGSVINFFVQLIIIRVPFLIKRTNKGMPFLDKPLRTIPLVIVGTFVLSLSIILNAGETISRKFFFSLITVISISGVLTLLYWRTAITSSYIERQNIRKLFILNHNLQEREKYIKELEADNERLGKIVHRDNKLVPAMELAVEKYMMEVSDSIAVTLEEKGQKILDELREMAEERKGLIDIPAVSLDKLPLVGVLRVDNLLDYMQQKASEYGIELHMILNCDFKEMLEKSVDEELFCTLLADLIDNAINATKYNKGTQILIDISIIKKALAVHIFDSGIPFTKEVLLKYGVEQITTHADDKGNGIGMMQTYEILNKCGASLFIDEFSEEGGLYTKKVSVVFNRKHQYVLYTDRNDEDITYFKKRADMTVVKK